MYDNDVPTPADWRDWWPEAIGGASALPDAAGSTMHLSKVSGRAVPFGDRALPKNRARNAGRAEKGRADRALCARDFLTWGDTRGVHAKFCMFGEDDPCSRDYDPWPYAEASPDPRLYEGTGIGALYGLRNTERHLWQLAGWNLTTQKFEPVPPTPTEGKT